MKELYLQADEMGLAHIVITGEEPLVLKIRHFGKYVDTCLIAEDRNFLQKNAKKIYGYRLPVPCSEVFENDYIIDKRDFYKPSGD